MDKLKMNPFVKWAGGKTQLLPRLEEFMPRSYHRYYEPFIGGGALLLDVQPARAVINDINEQLLIKAEDVPAEQVNGKVALSFDRLTAEMTDLRVTSQIPDLPTEIPMTQNGYDAQIYEERYGLLTVEDFLASRQNWTELNGGYQLSVFAAGG